MAFPCPAKDQKEAKGSSKIQNSNQRAIGGLKQNWNIKPQLSPTRIKLFFKVKTNKILMTHDCCQDLYTNPTIYMTCCPDQLYDNTLPPLVHLKKCFFSKKLLPKGKRRTLGAQTLKMFQETALNGNNLDLSFKLFPSL